MANERPAGDDHRQLNSINKLVHEPARLAILAHLYVVDNADFIFLERQTGLTPGNLSRHLSKLEASKYVGIRKEFVGNRPRTTIWLTEEGRRAFRDYASTMKGVLGGLL
jgi:DNA-binding MarR family transcriptional regulator